MIDAHQNHVMFPLEQTKNIRKVTHMRPNTLTEIKPEFRLHLTPVLADEFIEEDEEGVDPYQEFFNHLLTQGVEASEAWDRVWENPARSGTIGAALSAM